MKTRNKKLYSGLSFTNFFLMINAVGCVERDLVPLWEGVFWMWFHLAGFALFALLANKKAPSGSANHARRTQKNTTYIVPCDRGNVKEAK